MINITVTAAGCASSLAAPATDDDTFATTTFAPLGNGWSAAIQTPAGPMTALGEPMGEAQHRLDGLLVITRAVEISRPR